ncbi:FecR family protein [Ancylobacter sp.]|uniref:FecR family protein n=1 Tax=Ancylobacter sp. TaxID=1872567 RepID=UPI003D1098C4
MRRRTSAPTTNEPLTERALSWLVRLHSGSETEQDWIDYHEWKMAHPSHAGAAARAEHVWSRLGPALKPSRPAVRKVAGALVLFAALAGVGASGFFSSWFADQATQVGEVRIVALDDGSSLVMDSATSVDLDFSAAERRLRVLEGQIFVKVAADASRPFIVEAGGGEVRALGTAFNIRRDGARTDVSVAEHSVRVSLASAGRVDVGEGQGVDFDPATGLSTPRAVDVEDVTAWRRGEILFEGRPLGEVAREMGRYRRGAIVFMDDTLKQLPVTGAFSSRNVNEFFLALEQTLPVRVTRLPYLILIRRAAE